MIYKGVLVLALVMQVRSQCLGDDDRAIPQTDTKEVLFYGQQNFTLKVFEAVNRIQPTDNVFFSPFSVYQALLLAYFAAANETERAIKQALLLNPDESKISVMKSYKLEKFLNEYQPQESYEFTSANRVYVDNHLPVRDCMLKLFQEEMEKLNFKQESDAARVHMNQWVMNVTKNNIKDLLPFGTIDDSTQLVLINAAYFKGVWASRFDSDRTSKEIFYASPEKQTFVEMMRQKGRFNYGVSEELGAQVLEMPYKGENVSMYVLLPPFAAQNGIENILEKFSPSALTDIVEENILAPRQVEVEFPKFTMEKSLPMKEVFLSMGAGAVFDPDSDYSALTGEYGAHFNDATHKAKIRVDENGTVAAAATAIFSFRSSRPVEQPKFICNHPFVHFLYDKPTKTILFMGIFRDPKRMSA